MSGRMVAYRRDQVEQVLQEIIASLPVFIDITTPTSTGTELKVQHDLGRIPNGYAVVHQPYVSFFHGHDSTDTAWDEHFMYIKFSTASKDLTIAVF